MPGVQLSEDAAKRTADVVRYVERQPKFGGPIARPRFRGGAGGLMPVKPSGAIATGASVSCTVLDGTGTETSQTVTVTNMYPAETVPSTTAVLWVTRHDGKWIAVVWNC